MDYPANHNKWQQMLAIISKHPQQIQPSQKNLIFVRLFIENFLVFAFQYTGLMLSVIHSRMPIQLATGTACAFLFLRSYAILPGIWLGSFLAYFIAHAAITVCLLYASLFTLQIAMIFVVCCRSNIPTLIFYDKKNLFTFLIYIAGITGLYHLNNPTQWLANINGILVISVALVTFDAFFPQINALKKQNKLIIAIPLMLLIACTLGLLTTKSFSYFVIYLFLNLMATLFMSYRFGWCGAVSAIFISGILINFGIEFLAIANRFVTIQLFITITALMAFITAAKQHAYVQR